jgi:pimeloyl-ACP methyl ester carboxylesterase
VGAYRLNDGSALIIKPSDGDTLQWFRIDGTMGILKPGANGVLSSTLGYTDKPDGHTASFSPCDQGEIHFDALSGARIPLDVTETTFTRGDVTFAGRLLLPKGEGPVPIVVLVHGGEHSSARDFQQMQWILPSQGIGVFVYDKRGTGHSTGKFSLNFDVLADDAVSAIAEARRMAGARAGRVGYWGGSQGGWVAPLAAFRTRADFVIVGYGLLIDPLEEDREEVALEMSLKGHTPKEIAQAEEVAYAAETILASNYTRGLDEFDALRAKYRSAPWYKDLQGNLTRFFLPLSAAQIPALKEQIPIGIAWGYDGMEVAKRLDTPQLWQLATDDLQAPSAETTRRMKLLMDEGAPVTLAVFPHAEHGMYEYVINAKGERDDTRNPEGYFAMICDFARDGHLHGTYGRASITLPKAGH